jgi:hypothetical protein
MGERVSGASVNIKVVHPVHNHGDGSRWPLEQISGEKTVPGVLCTKGKKEEGRRKKAKISG